MLKVEWYVFKDFLEAEPQASRDKLNKILSSDLFDDLHKIQKMEGHPHLGFLTEKENLNQIHYTWLIPFFQSLSDHDRYLFVSVLIEEHKEGLYKFFDLTKEPKELSLVAQKYSISLIHHEIFSKNTDLLPIACLPHNPLNNLLTLSRKQLLIFVDLLSMHDLAYEMSNLINASSLDKIKKILKPEQKKYLSSLAKHVEPITFKSMGLSLWNGDEESLKSILHQRGLNRLAKALVYSHPSFIFHLQHKLDTGRASVVKTLIRQLKNKKAHQILISQVCRLLEIVKT